MFYSVFKTKLGWVGLLHSEHGLKRLILPVESKEQALRLLSRLGSEKEFNHPCEPEIIAYFEGTPINFHLQLDMSDATHFQRIIWQVTGNIPYGSIRSYSWVASQIDHKSAYRAVGQALARNPLPIIVPCHRVIYSGGRLGGYAGKLSIADFKRTLLRLEGLDI
jgi:methylated-DNA-[protein]-cysteine S-methyltransferase